MFISIYGFSQTFWLNLITRCTFFKTNLWFNACFQFLMYITYSFLSCKLATSFSTFSVSSFSGKNDKSLWSSCNFLRHWTSTSRKYLSSLSSLYFFIKASINWEISFIHSKLFTGNFSEAFTSQYWIYGDSFFYHNLSCICY